MSRNYVRLLGNIARKILIVTVAVHFMILLYGILFSLYSIFFNPPFSSLELQRRFISGVKIEKKIFVEYKKIPKHIKRMVVISEDYKFWNHNGIDIEAIDNAYHKNRKAGKIKAGGSTITQQLVKTMLLFPQKSFIRKYIEIIIALEVDLILSKERILELYLNYIELGKGVFGIERASYIYFGKHVSTLSKDESAALITIIPSPVKYNPSTYMKSKVMKNRYDYLIKMTK